MPWTPQNDFEEEIVNLQPDHDFIFGFLSEPQYPRPTSHTDHALAKKLQEDEQQKQFTANSAISAKLRVIQQVQSIANTKPLGEQPNLDDWDTNENLEQETIGLMRHFGLGASVEQPLDQKATIASHPVKNANRIVRNGCRKVPLFLDDNMFKLRERVSENSSGVESCNNGDFNKFTNNINDSLASEVDGVSSANTSSSISFTTAGDCNNSVSSAVSSFKKPMKIGQQRFNQYDKLLEDNSLQSLNCSKDSLSSQQASSESFRTFSKCSWRPVVEDDDDDDELLFNKKENWPALSKNKKSSDKNSVEDCDVSNCTDTDSTNANSSEASNKPTKRENFLDRFIKTDKTDNLDTTTDSTSTTSPQKPKTYASITKTKKSPAKKKETTPSDFITTFPPFYTTRKMHALKRNVK